MDDYLQSLALVRTVDCRTAGGLPFGMDLELKRPIVFFDVETTGLDPEHDRIVELAAIKLHPDGAREEATRRFNPLVPIPKEATAIHGITNEDVKDKEPFYQRAEKIASFFRGSDLGGYNIIYFDIPLLKKELERAGQDLDLSDVSVVDVMRIFKRKEPRDLGAAVRFYCKRDHEDAHSAAGDVKATVDVLFGQLAMYKDLPRTPEALDLDVRHPESVDRMGKLRWVNGEIALSFGKHKGRTLEYLARNEPDYLKWLIDNRVIEDAAHHLRDALALPFAKPNPHLP